MNKQTTDLMDSARDVLKRIDVVDRLVALDEALYRACTTDSTLVAAHTMNHVAFMATLADTPEQLDRILALMNQVQQEIVETKRQQFAGAVPRSATVH